MEIDLISETLRFLVFRILDVEQISEPQQFFVVLIMFQRHMLIVFLSVNYLRTLTLKAC
jgi:hypothetical protein